MKISKNTYKAGYYDCESSYAGELMLFRISLQKIGYRDFIKHKKHGAARPPRRAAFPLP